MRSLLREPGGAWEPRDGTYSADHPSRRRQLPAGCGRGGESDLWRTGAARMSTSMGPGRAIPRATPSPTAWDLDGDGTVRRFDCRQSRRVRLYLGRGRTTWGVKVTDPRRSLGHRSRSRSRPGTRPRSAQIDAPTGQLSPMPWAMTIDILRERLGRPRRRCRLRRTAGSVIDQPLSERLSCPPPIRSFHGGHQRIGSRRPDHDYPSSLTVKLTVTDSGGLSGTDAVTIYPRTVQLGTLDSSPPGVEIGIDQANGDHSVHRRR